MLMQQHATTSASMFCNSRNLLFYLVSYPCHIHDVISGHLLLKHCLTMSINMVLPSRQINLKKSNNSVHFSSAHSQLQICCYCCCYFFPLNLDSINLIHLFSSTSLNASRLLIILFVKPKNV
jgi:hypothetical protein